jgi:hypothetical protein
MAIFNFPVNPISGQTYFAPNGVTYTWDGEKWVGSGSGTFFNPTDFVEKTPDAGNRQSINAGQPTDTALRLKGATGQAANLLEFESANGTVYSVFDELGRFGYGVLSPTQAIDVIGNIKLTGGIVANNSLGTVGQVLKSDGSKVYWANGASDLDSVLKSGNVTNEDMTIGDLVVQGDLTVRGTQTIIETEVIKLADNIITLNSNYTGSTPNEDAGIQVNRGTLPAKTFYWDETLDRWSVGAETLKAGLFEGNLVGNVTGTVSSLANHTTDGLNEGLNNLYFTQARARQSIAAAGDISYNQSTGVISYTESVKSVNGKIGNVVLNTDDVAEGVTNKYFSNTIANAWLATKSINDLLDVNTTTVAPDDILYFNGTTWTTRPGDFQDNFVTSGNFNFTTGVLTHSRNDGNTINVNMDGRYLRLDAGGTVSGATIFDGAIVFNSTVRTSTVPAANNDIVNKLYVDTLVANSEVQVQSFAFDTTTGQLVLTETDSSAFTVDLDGRYVQTVNGIVPDALGNIALSLTGTGTGTLASRPATANNGSVYILSGETGVNANTNGETYIYVTSTATWQRIVSFDQAESDIRYINAAGDTMTGALTLVSDPTTNLEAATKQYVDALVANSEIYTANASLNSTTGILTQTRTNGTTYDVNLYTGLDGRYVNVTGDTMTGNLTIDGTLIANNTTLTLGKLADVADAAASANGQVLTWNNTTSAWEPRALPVDGFTTGAVFNSTDGIITFTRVDGSTFTVDLDGRYLELTAGGTVTGATTFSNTVTVATAPTLASHVANKAYVDALVSNSEIYTNTAVLNSTTGILTQTRTNGSTYTVDLFGGLDARYVNASGDTVNGDIIVNGNTTINGTLIANNTTLTLDKLADVTSASATTGQVLSFNGTNWIAANAAPGALNALSDVDAAGLANGDILYWNATAGKWDLIAGDFVDNFVNSIAFDTTTGVFTATRNDGNNYTVDLDGRYLELTTGGTVVGATTFSNTVTVSTAPTIGNHVTNKTYVDALIANSEIYTSSAAFSAATGVMTFTRNDSTTYTVDIDGRFAQTVNGIVPDGVGNIAVSLTAVQTGTFAARPGTANAGVVYVVSGDTANSNGKTYIYESVSAQWYEVKGFDEAAADARYVNVAGDAMTGALTLPADPTNALEAATKQYVDAKVANSEVYTNTAVLDSTTGILTQTRTNGSTYTVDLFSGLDARYVNVSGDTMTGTLGVVGLSANGSIGVAGQVLTSDGTKSYWAAAGGSGTVTNVATGTGLTGGPITTTGTIALDLAGNLTWTGQQTFSNTTFLSAISANGSIGTAGQVLTSDGTKSYWAATGGTGTVTSVATSTDLTGGPITTTGTLGLSTTGVAAGSQGSANSVATFTVDDKGRLTAAGNTAIAIDWSQITSGKPTTLAGYGITDGVISTRSITGATSLTGGGNLTADRTISLVNDNAAPGNSFYYGTDGTGTKGFFALPAGGGGGSGTVTNVATGTGLTGGPITTTGTLSLDTAATLTWTGPQTFANTASFSNTITIAAVSANGSVGVAGQVLTSDGTKSYWSAAGGTGTVTNVAVGAGLAGGPITTTGTLTVDNTASFSWSNTHTFSNTVFVNAVSANGSLGTAGQVLTSTGTDTYWTTLSAAGFDNYITTATYAANNNNQSLTLGYANTSVANVVVNLSHGINSHTDVDTATVAPVTGQILAWNGTNWVPTNTDTHVTISTAPPTGQLEGDLWYDSNTTFRTYVWSATAASWLDVAPQPTGGSPVEYINELVDVDTATKVPVSGSSVLGWNGTNWVPVEILDANGGTANDF